MLIAHEFNESTGEVGRALGQVGFDGQLGTDWGALIAAGTSLASKYIPGAKTVTSTACDVITNPIGAAAGALVLNKAGASGSSIVQDAKYAQTACKTVSPGTTPTSPTPTAPTNIYPPGTIQWRSSSTGLWMIAVPKTPGLSGSGLGAIAYSYGLGGADEDTALGATHVIRATSPTQVPGIAVVTEAAGKAATDPVTKKWWFWALLVGGVFAVGTGGYLLFRRKPTGA